MASAIDLILLGMIQEKPQSAYDLQKTIDDRNISCWVHISKTSIYKKIQMLEEKGYVESEVVKEGNMPQKTIYAITFRGKECILDHMRKISKEALGFFIDYNAVLINMPSLEKEMQKELLLNMNNGICDFAKGVKENIPEKVQVSIFGDAIIQQQIMLASAMEQWMEQFMKGVQL
jgi:DNA-binding PadR family transcriptional regulator